MSSDNIKLADIHVAPNRRLRAIRTDLVDDLAESMKERGLLQPITARRRSDGGYSLVSGRHRFEAAKLLAWSTIAVTVTDIDDDDEAELAEIDENLIRGELSPAERALHVGRRKELYEKLHPETKHGATGRGRVKSRQNGDSIRFSKDAAKTTGRSERTLQREIERATKIADLAEVIGTPLDSPDELDALAKLPGPVQGDLIARVKAGETITAKHLNKKLNREARERKLAAATEKASAALGEKHYGVIYADPPWPFDVWTESGNDRAASNHYPTLTLEAIKALPMPAAQDAVLFLWSTVPILPQALAVMQAWDFTYKSAIVWSKGREGTGYWTRNRVEFLLIGTRGNVPAPAPGGQPPQVIEARRGCHSEKPAIFAEMIERLFPNVPRLEMFARKAQVGWDVHGNEAPSDKEIAEKISTIPDDLSNPPGLLRARVEVDASAEAMRADHADAEQQPHAGDVEAQS